MHTLDPKDYHLRMADTFELADTFDRNRMSALADLQLYRNNPEWFLRKDGIIDYDDKVGPRQILEARRKLRIDEDPQKLLEETIDAFTVNDNELWRAQKRLDEFFKSADQLVTLRAEGGVSADKLAYYLDDVSRKAIELRELSGVIPESCLRKCSELGFALITPNPPEDPWKQRLNTSRQTAFSITGKTGI